ncbi:conserved integral membrane domain protein [Mycobacterium ulcerans str. Harvey]|uniref:Conserved integral membrane domain protein n=1 Tax=Mycobacterium ulcerans str. Harvey TaxID=1299332 RepID=A0ABP3AVV3_MYCUL|nr:conserved integral membrane domain protein [Mycobacterium ulcerans str. Harvey]
MACGALAVSYGTVLLYLFVPGWTSVPSSPESVYWPGSCWCWCGCSTAGSSSSAATIDARRDRGRTGDDGGAGGDRRDGRSDRATVRCPSIHCVGRLFGI